MDELTNLSFLAAERFLDAARATFDRDLANDLIDLAERLRPARRGVNELRRASDFVEEGVNKHLHHPMIFDARVLGGVWRYITAVTTSTGCVFSVSGGGAVGDVNVKIANFTGDWAAANSDSVAATFDGNGNYSTGINSTGFGAPTPAL